MKNDLSKALGITTAGTLIFGGVASTLFWVWVALVKAGSVSGVFLSTGESTHLDQIPLPVFWITGILALAVFVLFLAMTAYTVMALCLMIAISYSVSQLMGNENIIVSIFDDWIQFIAPIGLLYIIICGARFAFIDGMMLPIFPDFDPNETE